MCKLLGIVGAKTDKKTQEALSVFVNAAQKVMTAHDRDGFGYAAVRKNDAGGFGVTGEKWVDTDDVFARLDKRAVSYMDDLPGLVKDPMEGYADVRWGEVSDKDPIVSVIAHARFATCDVVLENTHPFFDETNEVVLTHNGVISNHMTITKYQSSCDSESILTAYVEENVRKDIKGGVQRMIDRLQGSYACFVLAKNKTTGGWYVDVFRNSRCLLHVAYVTDFGCYVFATTEKIISEGAKKAGVKHKPIVTISPGHILRLDAETGTAIDGSPFAEPVVTYYNQGQYGGVTKYTQGSLDRGD
jgi:predicted glutamine amidotransferase